MSKGSKAGNNNKKIGGKKKANCSGDIFLVSSPQTAKSLEGKYKPEDTSFSKVDSSNVTKVVLNDRINDDLKEYVSTKTMVLPSMIRRAVSVMDKRPTVLTKPKPQSKELVQQAICHLGSEQADRNRTVESHRRSWGVCHSLAETCGFIIENPLAGQ
jgi:hypothetical protein